MKGYISRDNIYVEMQNVPFGHILVEDMLKDMNLYVKDMVKFTYDKEYNAVLFYVDEAPDWFVESYEKNRIKSSPIFMNQFMQTIKEMSGPYPILVYTDEDSSKYKVFKNIHMYKYFNIDESKYLSYAHDFVSYDRHLVFAQNHVFEYMIYRLWFEMYATKDAKVIEKLHMVLASWSKKVQDNADYLRLITKVSYESIKLNK